MYIISVSASSDKWRYYITKVNHKETKVCYKLEDNMVKQIKKEDISKSYTIMRDDVDYINRKMMCLDKSEIKDCVTKLYNEVTDVMNSMTKKLESMKAKQFYLTEYYIEDCTQDIVPFTITDDMF